MKFFSIVVCTLNSEKFLVECLDSIRNQTFTNYEIIVVDGGSTDNTLDIVLKYNVDKVINNVSGGVSRAMNVGIINAKGQIISILHSDDYYYSVNTLSLVWERFQNQDSKWLYGNLVRNIEGINYFYQSPEYSRSDLLHTFNIPHPTVFVKKEVYTAIGLFDERYKFAMDYELLLRISHIYNPIQLSEYLTVFRVHSGSLSSSNWFKAQNESFIIQQKFAPNIYVKLKGIFRFVKTRIKYYLN